MNDPEHFDEKPRPLDLAVWWQILARARPYRWHAVGLAISAVTIAAADAMFPLLVGYIVDEVTLHDGRRLMEFGAYYLAVAALLCLGVLGFILLAGRIATAVCHDIRVASFERLQELSFSYFDHQPVGWLMSRLTSDCDRLSRIIGWVLLDFLWGSSLVGGIAVLMLMLNWQMALVILASAPLVVGVSLWFRRHMLLSARAVRKSNAEITARFNEGISGAKTTKSLVRENAQLAEFQTVSSEMLAHSVRNLLQAAVYIPLVVSLGSAMSGLALWFGGGRVLDGRMSVGTLVTFMNYAVLFFDPIYEMARQLTEMQMAQAAAERIQGLLDTQPQIKDSSQVRQAIAAHAAQPEGVEEARGVTDDGVNDSREATGARAADGGLRTIRCVEFRDVSFGYDPESPVLEAFNLRVSEGQTIALVGSTGGGKSTIVSLLCRFYEPTAGEVLLDGVDYRRRSLAWLQSSLGIVLQTAHLFSGTIRDNIRYGKLSADDDQIERAARLSGAHDFIATMADGYETDVGEGGSKLSTGQKQLISLARAILSDPQIFVMDEATSSVDTETEFLIQRGIDRVLSGRISFVIAHRLSTIRSADRILVIENGRVQESGKHEELLARGGRYHQLHRHQWG